MASNKKTFDHDDDNTEALVKYYEQKWAEEEKKGGKKGAGFTTTLAPRCHESHKVLKVANGYLCGASCIHPRPGFDVYVGFDTSMHTHSEAYPWKTPRIEQVYFPIKDYSIPTNVPEFKAMVTWICNQLQAGKKVHMGCIGGHGRTGTVMAAVMAELGEKDAIAWVRKNHCTSAVESEEQVKFLVKHYGVLPAKGAKIWVETKGKGKGGSKQLTFDSQGNMVTSASFKSAGEYGGGSGGGSDTLSPVTSKKYIWTRH